MRAFLIFLLAALPLLAAGCGGAPAPAVEEAPTAPATATATTAAAPTATPQPTNTPAPTATATPTPAPQPVSVASQDGQLAVDVPAGALTETVDITVRALGPDETPPELQAFHLRGTLYELGPDGLTFEQPVTITRRVDTEQAGFDLSRGVPLIFLASRDSEANWEFLADQTITLDGTVAIVTGTTTHFSTVVAFGSGFFANVPPELPPCAVGGVCSFFDIQIWNPQTGQWEVFMPAGEEPGVLLSEAPLEYQVQYSFDLTGVTGIVPADSGAGLGCGEAGSFPVDLETRVWGDSGALFPPLVEPLGVSDVITQTLNSMINLPCTPPRGPPPIVLDPPEIVDRGPVSPVTQTIPIEIVAMGLEAACVRVTHMPLGNYPSFLTFDGQLGGDYERLTRLDLAIRGANAGQPVEAPVGPGGHVEADLGISSYGQYDPLELIGRNDDGTTVNLTEFFQALIGSFEVGPGEGVLAGTCPP